MFRRCSTGSSPSKVSGRVSVLKSVRQWLKQLRSVHHLVLIEKSLAMCLTRLTPAKSRKMRCSQRLRLLLERKNTRQEKTACTCLGPFRRRRVPFEVPNLICIAYSGDPPNVIHQSIKSIQIRKPQHWSCYVMLVTSIDRMCRTNITDL